MKRPPLTDKKNRALCLAFRNGKRCGRLATCLVRGEGAYCKDCASNRVILQVSDDGFLVQIIAQNSAWPSRQYINLSKRIS